MQKVSCIIPMYNEVSRISTVLTVLTQISYIGEIICVDDGSSDGGAQLIKKHFPHVHLIIHKVNQGKAGAVKTWIQASSYDNIFLCDADIEWLVKKEIEAAIQVFFKKKCRYSISEKRKCSHTYQDV